MFYIEDKEIVLEPRINEEYYLYTDTIGENAIGFSTKQGEYGFMDFNGYILFTINRFFVFEGKKIDRLRFLYFFILVDLRMELYMLVGVIIQKNMIKAVIY